MALQPCDAMYLAEETVAPEAAASSRVSHSSTWKHMHQEQRHLCQTPATTFPDFYGGSAIL